MAHRIDDYEARTRAALALMCVEATGHTVTVHDPDIAVAEDGRLHGVTIGGEPKYRRVGFDEMLTVGRRVMDRVRSIRNLHLG